MAIQLLERTNMYLKSFILPMLSHKLSSFSTIIFLGSFPTILSCLSRSVDHGGGGGDNEKGVELIDGARYPSPFRET